MTWKDYLTEAERERLDRLERIRDESAAAFRSERKLLKSRAESRMRQEAKRDEG